jgi:hypothetical protein
MWSVSDACCGWGNLRTHDKKRKTICRRHHPRCIPHQKGGATGATGSTGSTGPPGPGANPVAISVSTTADQEVTGLTDVQITFDVVDYNVNWLVVVPPTPSITIPTTGIYQVQWFTQFSGGCGSLFNPPLRQSWINVDGVRPLLLENQVGAPSGIASWSGIKDLFLTQGQVITMQVRCDSTVQPAIVQANLQLELIIPQPGP